MTLQPSSRWTRGFRRVATITAVTSAVLGSHGCGDTLAECTVDADCDQGQACELSECVPTCDADSDCDDSEACLQGLTTQQRICQSADAMTNANNPTRASFALVRDRTEGDGCQSDEPGADIAFVLLEDAEGSPLAWARVVQADVEQGTYAAYDHIDGDAPDWGADSCPEFLDANVVSLGCDGALAVEFIDDAGARVAVESDEQKLRVGEFGAQCDDGADEDAYEVFLCPGAETTDDLPATCTLSVGVGQGERAFEY